MEAILRAAKRGRIPAEPVVVVSSRPDAAALAVAERMGVETEVVGWAGDRDAHDLAVDAALRRHGVVGDGGLVCLAGFMRILGPRFVSARRNRVMNVHPSLLPAFPGLDAQGQAVRYGAKVSGCTVHFVDEGVDTGPRHTAGRRPRRGGGHGRGAVDEDTGSGAPHIPEGRRDVRQGEHTRERKARGARLVGARAPRAGPAAADLPGADPDRRGGFRARGWRARGPAPPRTGKS